MWSEMNMRPLPEELIKHPWITGTFNTKKLYKMKADIHDLELLIFFSNFL